MQTLKFSTGNGKLSDRLIFSLPAGYSCPHAGVCKTFADRVTGKIRDLPQLGATEAAEFRCFAAMSEVRPNVRDARWYNWDLIREVMYQGENQSQLIADLLDLSLTVQKPKDLVRVHESGDFWTEVYMKAWMLVAARRPHQKFYAYTKSLNMWYNLRDIIPSNLYLTASWGGTLDSMIEKFPDVFYRHARVVYTEQEAIDLGLEIDHSDELCFGNKPFALLVHGSQRAGSEASKAIGKRRKEKGFIGYGKSNKTLH